MKLKSIVALLVSILFIAVSAVIAMANGASGKMLYVTNSGNHTVSTVDISTGKVVNTLRVGVWPAGIEIDAATGRAYVLNSSEGDSTVSVIDLKSNSIVATVKVGIGPMSIAIDSANGLGYVTDTEEFKDGKNLSHTISIIDLKTNKVLKQVDVGVGPFDIELAGKNMFVSNSADWTVAFFSTTDHKVVKGSTK